jgi:hypothetical protein
MDSYWMFDELGKTRHADFLREADRARRFLSSKQYHRLSALVQSLILIFG